MALQHLQQSELQGSVLTHAAFQRPPIDCPQRRGRLPRTVADLAERRLKKRLGAPLTSLPFVIDKRVDGAKRRSFWSPDVDHLDYGQSYQAGVDMAVTFTALIRQNPGYQHSNLLGNIVGGMAVSPAVGPVRAAAAGFLSEILRQAVASTTA